MCAARHVVHACTFTLLVSGADAGDTIVDQIAVEMTDDDDETVTPTDTETVTVTDVLPTITVEKDNGDASLAAPGITSVGGSAPSFPCSSVPR